MGSVEKTNLEAQCVVKLQAYGARGKSRQSALAYVWENARELVVGKSIGKSVCVWQPRGDWCHGIELQYFNALRMKKKEEMRLLS